MRNVAIGVILILVIGIAIVLLFNTISATTGVKETPTIATTLTANNNDVVKTLFAVASTQTALAIAASPTAIAQPSTPTPQPTENANSIRTQVALEFTETALASSGMEMTVTALANALASVTKAAEAKATNT